MRGVEVDEKIQVEKGNVKISEEEKGPCMDL